MEKNKKIFNALSESEQHILRVVYDRQVVSITKKMSAYLKTAIKSLKEKQLLFKFPGTNKEYRVSAKGKECVELGCHGGHAIISLVTTKTKEGVPF